MHSPTLWMLMAEFNSPVVNLSDCLHHLDYATIGEANRAAKDGKLPVPTFTSRDSKRPIRKVHLTDLADMIDTRRERGFNSWCALNGVEHKSAGENPRRSKSMV